MTKLPDGLYDLLVTQAIRHDLAELGQRRRADTEALEPADSYLHLARHIATIVRTALRAIPKEERLARQTQIANDILQAVATSLPEHFATGDLVAEPPQRLAAAMHPIDAQQLEAERPSRRRLMMNTGVVGTIALVTCLGLAVAPVHAQQKKKTTGTKTKAASSTTNKKATNEPPDTITYNGVKDLATLEDGAYEADGWYSKHPSYRSYSFQKRGSAVTGYAADHAGVWCFQGTFTGNIISIAHAVRWKDDYDDRGRTTGGYGFEPLWDSQEPEFVSVRLSDEVRTFPVRRVGWMRTHPSIIARNERWMQGCLEYFSESSVASQEPDPPPCDDESLRGTEENEGTGPKYQHTSTVCTITEEPQHVALIRIEGGVCSVENVFDVLIRTPSAIAPTLDDDQRVKNCGVLDLMSVTSPNRIKVEIDDEHYRVLNYTMRGHKFYPGRVVRQIVEENGKVKVVTTGTGKLAWWKDIENQVEAGPIWLAVDQRLKVIFAREYKLDEEEEESDDDQ